MAPADFAVHSLVVYFVYLMYLYSFIGNESSMIVTDLDGTLLNSEHILSKSNSNTLNMLGEKKVVRVVATGRVLYSACS